MSGFDLDDDIRLFARGLYGNRGFGAVAYAQARAAALQSCGDLEGHRVWLRVSDEIARLSQPQSAAGGSRAA